MIRRGVWVFLSFFVLLAIGIRTDAVVHKAHNQESESTVVLAPLVMQNVEDAVKVEPEYTPTDNPQQKSQNSQEIDEELILTFLTFNIHSANNQAGNVTLEQIIEEIKETDAQIIGLQEVENRMPRSDYKDQARLIAEELGYHYYYGENINILGVQYGNALLSKYPIIDAQNHKLPKKLLEPRGLIEARIDVEGTPYHVYVTHLGLNPVERDMQIDYINEQVSKREGNIFILGDFNNHPDSEEMQKLDTFMVDSAAALDKCDLFTFTNWIETPKERIDRIYVSEQIDLKHHEVMLSEVSDHRRVITQIVHKTQTGEGIYNAVANKDNNGVSLPID